MFFTRNLKYLWLLPTFLTSNLSAETAEYTELYKRYHYNAYELNESQSDICQHIPTLRELAMQCTSITEIGLGWVISTWGILQGLADSPFSEKRYLGIDWMKKEDAVYDPAYRLGKGCGIDVQFLWVNDLNIELEPVDMLFIDSMHTYCHLTYELEKFSPKVAKYIAMHDTSEPWGDRNDAEYSGNYSEYPSWINRNKKGLWPAVEDFLTRHPEWTLKKRYFNNHGFTILERKGIN